MNIKLIIFVYRVGYVVGVMTAYWKLFKMIPKKVRGKR